MANTKTLTTDEHRQMILQFQKDPVFAAETLINFRGKPLRLATHQRIVLRSLWEGKPYNMFVMGRGVSKSWIIALYLLLNGTLRANRRMGIISASYRQSQWTFDYVDELYNGSPYIQQGVKKPPTKSPTECSIIWHNGNSIKALPLGDGVKLRGLRLNVLGIDEAAVVPADIIDTILIPMLNTSMDPMNPNAKQDDFQIIMSSSACYQFNPFYSRYDIYKKKVAEGDPDYNVQEFTYEDCPPGFINMKALQHMRETAPRVKFRMENENYFPPDSDGFFQESLLAKIVSERCLVEEVGDPDSQYVMGVDPASESANMAIVIMRIGEYNKVVRVHTMNRKSLPEMVDQIRYFMKKFNIVRIAMDQGGGGTSFRDILAQEVVTIAGDKYVEEKPILPIDPKEFPHRNGRRILDLVYFSSKVVNDMNHSLKAGMENYQVLLPAHPLTGDLKLEEYYKEIEELRDELANIVITPLRNGMFNFDTPKKSQKKDRYSALLLAYKAARDTLFVDEKPQKKLVKGFWVPFRIGR